MVSYSTADLNIEPRNGRLHEDLIITQADDVRILEYTLAKIACA